MVVIYLTFKGDEGVIEEAVEQENEEIGEEGGGVGENVVAGK